MLNCYCYVGDAYNNAVLAIKNEHTECLRRVLNNNQFDKGDIYDLYELTFDNCKMLQYIIENPPQNYKISDQMVMDIISHGNIQNVSYIIRNYSNIVKENFLGEG